MQKMVLTITGVVPVADRDEEFELYSTTITRLVRSFPDASLAAIRELDTARDFLKSKGIHVSLRPLTGPLQDWRQEYQ